MKVAIQGIAGSYHHQAATALFEEATMVECDTFEQLAQSVDRGESQAGVMAIGNSIAGSILPNYGLLQQYQLVITAEYFLPINHCLMAIAGQTLKDIEEVQSHPMALLQCKPFLNDLENTKLVETDDTAAAVMRIKRNHLKGVAAIASSIAASLYDLEIIAQDIQEEKLNATRFVVVEKASQPETENSNKATLNFTTTHEAGSLSRILSLFARKGLNLSKIQSIPIPEQPFLFSFVVDVEFVELQMFKDAVREVKSLTKEFNIMGIYKAATL
ncbi:prephenate dehydratase [Nonlabens ponticola]|uniref:prephenate dehydratase n=1 Tax=Nonlabens ponticola TaxID=2496866 RepID=A0A3S9MWP7_9FLAO|nr:prephenate dehydratase [Nonlabens ponticola]AZQ43564.1 prephenate dehydratase [Nonlabens ponticola]